MSKYQGKMETKEIVKLVALHLSLDEKITQPLKFYDDYFTSKNTSFAVQQCSINHSIQAISSNSASYIILFFHDKKSSDNTVVLHNKGLDAFIDTVEIPNLPQFKYKFHLDFVHSNKND